MSIVTVLTPHGRRQTVQLQPNQTCMHILTEVCRRHTDFSAADFELRHHRRIIDLTQMFRFAGLPNNAQLEMQARTKARTADGAVTLMVQLETGARQQADFAPDATVLQCLERLCGAEAANAADMVAVYMRAELWGERLATTTLRALGLTGGRAAMRVVRKDPAALRVQANVSAPIRRPAAAAAAVEPEESSAGDDGERTSDGGGGGSLAVAASASEQRGADDGDEQPKNDDVDAMETSIDVDAQTRSSPIDRKKQRTDATSTQAGPPAPPEAVEQPAASPAPPPAPPVARIVGPRNAVLFSLDDANGNRPELEAGFFDVDVSDLKVLLRDLRGRVADQADAPLLTARLRELAESKRTLQKLAQYRRSVLRVQFADRLVLQGIFGLVDRVQDVRDWVRGFLCEEVANGAAKEFELFTTPPKVVLANEATLVEADCVPNAVIHFGGIEEASAGRRALRAELLEQISAPEAADYEASRGR